MNPLDTKDQCEFVFHYTIMERALLILDSHQLRMGRFSETNDPMEFKNWALAMDMNHDPQDTIQRLIPLFLEKETVEKRVQSEFRVLCCTMDAKDNPGDAFVEERGYGLSKMWAQYADNHQGVCFALKRTEIDRELEKITDQTNSRWSKPVEYKRLGGRTPESEDKKAFTIDGDKIKSLGIEEAFHRHVEEHVERLLFTKSLDWRDEREYRWISSDYSSDSIHISIDGALAGVFAGNKSNTTMQKLLGHLCKDLQVPLWWMNWQRGEWTTPHLREY